MATESLFDAARIRELLTELGRRLHARGIEGRIFLVGGAAMALAYGRDRVTRDIDGVFEPKSEIYDEITRMAQDHVLPPDWLNDGVKGLLPGQDQGTSSATFDAPGLGVEVASPEYLFALKAAAARSEQDHDDLATLTNALGIESVDEAFEIIESYFDRGRLQPKTQFVVESVVRGTISKRSG